MEAAMARIEHQQASKDGNAINDYDDVKSDAVISDMMSDDNISLMTPVGERSATGVTAKLRNCLPFQMRNSSNKDSSGKQQESSNQRSPSHIALTKLPLSSRPEAGEEEHDTANDMSHVELDSVDEEILNENTTTTSRHDNNKGGLFSQVVLPHQWC